MAYAPINRFIETGFFSEEKRNNSVTTFALYTLLLFTVYPHSTFLGSYTSIQVHDGASGICLESNFQTMIC